MKRLGRWAKRGRIFDGDLPGWSHGSHPCVIHLHGDTFLFAVTCRTAEQKSHVFLSYVDVTNGTIAISHPLSLALGCGAPGHFDCDGVISGCIVKADERYYLYFVGWQNLPNGLWACDTGRAIVDPDTLSCEREFSGPILGRDRNHPLFAAATAFFVTEEGTWHTWYNSGVSWTKTPEGWHHRYGLYHAVSEDGLDWVCEPNMCIPFADDYEYAFGRPSVVRWDGVYRIWFAHRATRTTDAYRIGYAESHCGAEWTRDDSVSGIDVSASGWDSEMICYPSVFEHDGVRYMLYNGNGYGRTGVGYAVLEEAQ